MTNIHTLALSCALVFAGVGAPAMSQEDIVVSSDAVVAEVTRDLDRQLNASTGFGREYLGEGYAMIRFERGADGRPENVSLYRRSGSGAVDRFARRAVRRLGADGGLPTTADPNQKFQANIIVANDKLSHKKLVRHLAQAEAQRLASSPTERKVLALAGGTRKAS